MHALVRPFLALLFAAGALGVTAASADRGGKPPYCKDDHDHRAHHADYYDHHPKDRYYRAGPYRAGFSLTVEVSDRDRYDRDRRGRDRYDRDRRGRDRYDRDRRDHYDRYDRGGPRGSRVVKSRSFDTRYRARIHLVEIAYDRGRRRDYVCTVDVRGPEARYVPDRQVRAVAYRNCSRDARIRFV